MIHPCRVINKWKFTIALLSSREFALLSQRHLIEFFLIVTEAVRMDIANQVDAHPLFIAPITCRILHRFFTDATSIPLSHHLSSRPIS